MDYEDQIKEVVNNLEQSKEYVAINRKLDVCLITIQNIGILRIYKKKKGSSIDYSQIPDHFKERIMDAVEPLKTEKILGIDESGKGDYFGPLVVAGAYVIEPTKIRALGVMDSKRLTDEKILKLSEKIKKYCLINIVRIGPQRYNEMYEKINNLNRLLAWGHATAIENILKRESPDYIISDKFADEKVLISELGDLGKKAKLIQKTKAESNIAVAAASIVARAEFVLALQKLSFKFGMELPLGAGPEVRIAKEQFIRNNGLEKLGHVAKLHFNI